MPTLSTGLDFKLQAGEEEFVETVGRESINLTDNDSSSLAYVFPEKIW
jgi:hypothetical protein